MTMPTKTEKKSVATWMDENALTIDDLAQSISYSHGAVANWRQDRTYPDRRAVKAIARVGKRRGWSPLPEKA